ASRARRDDARRRAVSGSVKNTGIGSSARVAAAALVNLRLMTPARLRVLLEAWPDPQRAAAAVVRGDPRVVDGLSRLRADPRVDLGELAARWSEEADVALTERTLRRRRTHVYLDRDADYPVADPIANRPCVLLAEGDRLDALDAPRVAVVGTRAASPHGLRDAFELGAFLARAGCTVVSGLAI